MIEELNTLEKDVEAILLNDPFTRADDMLLYLKYLRSIGAAGDLAAVFSDRKRSTEDNKRPWRNRVNLIISPLRRAERGKE